MARQHSIVQAVGRMVDAGRWRATRWLRPRPGQGRPGPMRGRWPDDPWVGPDLAQGAPAACTICRWQRDDFVGPRFVEGFACPQCRSIVRDRVLFSAFIRRTPRPAGRLRVLETSPRLGKPYRRAMATWFDYVASDFDERHHKGVIRLDLQAIDLPDASVDVLLTPHVLEHVPDTDRALAEIHRVLAPGGRLVLQVPVLQGTTAPPAEPEFHGDNTPVFWRFGLDLTERLRAHGFTATVLCGQRWADVVHAGAREWPEPANPQWDVTGMLAEASRHPHDVTVLFSEAESRQVGLYDAYQCLTFECVKPA